MLRLVISLVSLWAGLCVSLKVFDCETLKPNDVMVQQSNAHFGISVMNEDGVGTNTFNDQSGLLVKITSPKPINGFIMQCRVPATETILGKFIAFDKTQLTASCGAANDTLVNSTNIGERQIMTKWLPLGQQIKQVNEIEFTVSIISQEYMYHSDIRSIVIDRKGTKKSSEDESKKKQEYNAKILRLGEEEQRTGEEEMGKEIQEREAEARRQEKERVDAELQEYEDRRKHEQRIRDELNEEEEYKKRLHEEKVREEMRQKEMKNIYDGFSSASCIVTSLFSFTICLVLSVLL